MLNFLLRWHVCWSRRRMEIPAMIDKLVRQQIDRSLFCFLLSGIALLRSLPKMFDNWMGSYSISACEDVITENTFCRRHS